jgi:radical SAM protein with 4Fe4S-binding SPASM domain
VVGTNGTGLTEARIRSLQKAGVTGVAVSIDSLNAERHNAFRHGSSALEQTTAAIERLRDARMDFIVQTSVTADNKHEVADLARWSMEKGAVSFNLYFLVETGRGQEMRELPASDNEAILRELVELEKEMRGKMLVRSKCQPALMRVVHQDAPDSPLTNYSTRCPCGVQYCRITPDGKLTPCPYLPEVAGDLRTQSFREVWEQAPLFQTIRARSFNGKCGSCEYRDVCGGCRARAFANTGDVMGSDDSCSYEPDGSIPVIVSKDTTYGTLVEPGLRWDPEAEARMQRIPSFVRGVVIQRTEDYARKQGHAVITLELLDEIRKGMPVDFSKKRPFFMRGGDDD